MDDYQEELLEYQAFELTRWTLPMTRQSFEPCIASGRLALTPPVLPRRLRIPALEGPLKRLG